MEGMYIRYEAGFNELQHQFPLCFSKQGCRPGTQLYGPDWLQSPHSLLTPSQMVPAGIY